MQQIKFKSKKQEAAFFEDVKYEVAQFFQLNSISSKADNEMIAKTFFWILLWISSWAFIIVFKNFFWAAACIGMLHMFTHVMIAFNITHDANHFAMFKKKEVNNFFGYFIELLGCNRRLWILSHNQEHHTFINIHQHDNNIEGYRLLRLCPQDKHRPHHKYQWLYAPFIYGLATLNYATIRDVKMIIRYIAKSKVKVSAAFVLEFIVFKILYYSYIFIVPVFVLNVSLKLVLFYFLIGHFVNGLFLALVFVTGHLTENTEYPHVTEGAIETNWAVHVIKTTGDYASKSGFMQWLVGGINLHVAHHLFPKICHVHYKKISPIIKGVAIKHGYVYREIPTFTKALRSHFMLLKRLGSP